MNRSRKRLSGRLGERFLPNHPSPATAPRRAVHRVAAVIHPRHPDCPAHGTHPSALVPLQRGRTKLHPPQPAPLPGPTHPRAEHRTWPGIRPQPVTAARTKPSAHRPVDLGHQTRLDLPKDPYVRLRNGHSTGLSGPAVGPPTRGRPDPGRQSARDDTGCGGRGGPGADAGGGGAAGGCATGGGSGLLSACRAAPPPIRPVRLVRPAQEARTRRRVKGFGSPGRRVACLRRRVRLRSCSSSCRRRGRGRRTCRRPP